MTTAARAGHPAEHDHPRRLWRELAAFYATVFTITWGLAALLFLAPDLVTDQQGIDGGRGRLAFLVAVSAPTLVGLALTLRANGLRRGVRSIARGVVPVVGWRRSLLWLFIGGVFIPVAWTVADLLSRVGGAGQGGSVDLHALFVGTPILLITTSFLLTDPGPLGEEYGWRGYALPRLLAVLNPTAAGLLVGAAMAVWHLPSYFATQLAQSELSFLLMVGNWLGWGVIASWVYLRSGGSWVAAGLVPHAVANAAVATGGVAVDAVWGTGALLAALVLVAMGVLKPRPAREPQGRAASSGRGPETGTQPTR